jgi:hypothetical protein
LAKVAGLCPTTIPLPATDKDEVIVLFQERPVSNRRQVLARSKGKIIGCAAGLEGDIAVESAIPLTKKLEKPRPWYWRPFDIARKYSASSKGMNTAAMRISFARLVLDSRRKLSLRFPLQALYFFSSDLERRIAGCVKSTTRVDHSV